MEIDKKDPALEKPPVKGEITPADLAAVDKEIDAVRDIAFESTERVAGTEGPQQVPLEITRKLSLEQEILFKVLAERFRSNMHRHTEIQWEEVQARLNKADQNKIWALHKMEKTGGEPDVVGFDATTGEYIFEDRCANMPKQRMQLCYDGEGEKIRKRLWSLETDEHYRKTALDSEVKIKGNVEDIVHYIEAELLTEEQYYDAQAIDILDSMTSCYLKTPMYLRLKGIVLVGFRFEKAIQITENQFADFLPKCGFRCRLRI